MIKKTIFALTTVCLSFVLSLIALELSVQLLGRIYAWESKTPQVYELSLFEKPLLPKRDSPYSLPTSIKDYTLTAKVKKHRVQGETKNREAYAEDYFIFEASGLHHPRPEHRSRAFVTAAESGEVVYDVHYTIDKYGRRVTPSPEGQQSDSFLALLGDSYVFGEGVEDNETLPAYIAKHAHKTKVYNMGFHGYAPNALLARSLVTPEFFQGISQEKGIGVYLFDSGDMARTIGSMGLISRWGGDLPEFEFGKQGPVYLGSFEQVYKTQIEFYQWVSKLETIQVLGIDWPTVYLPSHFEKVGTTIEALKDEFIKATNAQDFIVVLLREFENSNRLHHKIMDQLDKRKIKYLDYTQVDVSQISHLPLYIDYEGHPRPLFYKLLGRILVNDLEYLFDGELRSKRPSQHLRD